MGPLKVELDGCGLLGTEPRSSVKVASQLLSSLYSPYNCVEVCEFLSRRRRNDLKIIKAKRLYAQLHERFLPESKCFFASFHPAKYNPPQEILANSL